MMGFLRYWWIDLLLVCLVLFVLGFAGCGKSPVRKFMPGMYVSHGENEYFRASDTLIVSQLEGDHYLVIRRTGFRRLEDVGPGELSLRRDKWTAVFDEELGCLLGEKKLRQICFFPDLRELRLSNKPYQKIN